MHDACTHTVCIGMIQTLYRHDNYKVIGNHNMSVAMLCIPIYVTG